MLSSKQASCPRRPCGVWQAQAPPAVWLGLPKGFAGRGDRTVPECGQTQMLWC